MSRTLILYFSRIGESYVNGELRFLVQGNSQIAARQIFHAVGGDLFRLNPLVPYPPSYMHCLVQAKAEQHRQARPLLRQTLTTLEGYDTVFLSGPCWWGSYPMPVFTQLEELRWDGIRLLPLMSHEGSGLGHLLEDLQRSCPGARIPEALAVKGSQILDCEDIVAAWAKRNIT